MVQVVFDDPVAQRVRVPACLMGDGKQFAVVLDKQIEELFLGQVRFLGWLG